MNNQFENLLHPDLHPLTPEYLIYTRLEEVIQTMNQLDRLKSTTANSFMNKDYEGAVAEFSWLPGYIIKFDNGRIEGGEILKTCVEKKQLDLLLIPEQQSYSIPESYHHLTKLRKLCIAKKIEGRLGEQEIINRNQAQQLVILIKETGAGDLKWRNLVHCGDGRIAIIDTEIFFKNITYGLDSLHWKNSFDKDALQLVKEELEAIKVSYGIF